MPSVDKPRIVLRNTFNKETFIFSPPDASSGTASFDVVLEEGGSGGGNALLHVHPCAQETFTVKSGRLRIVIAGKEHFVEEGQSATIPRGAPHVFQNADAVSAEFKVEFLPAQQHHSFFANFASIAQNRASWFSAKGDPNFLLTALTLDTYRDHLYLAKLPISLQKSLFRLLAPLARWRGYKVEIAPNQMPSER